VDYPRLFKIAGALASLASRDRLGTPEQALNNVKYEFMRLDDLNQILVAHWIDSFAACHGVQIWK
jgi:hypothetical protein